MKAAILLLLVAVVCIHADFFNVRDKNSLVARSLRNLRSPSNTNAGSCPGLACLKDGAACDANDQFESCSSSSYCANGVCTKAIADGGSCTTGNDASCDGDDSYCTGGVCTPATYGGAGAACDYNGGALACSSQYACAINNANATVCTLVPSTAGADCSLYGICAGPNICKFSNGTGTCVALFSVAIGSPCDDSYECVPNSYCAARPQVCTAAVKSSLSPCDSNLHCSNALETCGCPLTTKAGSTGTCYAPATLDATVAGYLTAVSSCVLTANCGGAGCVAPCKSSICNFYHNFDLQYPSALSCFNHPDFYVSACGVDAPSTSDLCMNHAVLGAVALAAVAAL